MDWVLLVLLLLLLLLLLLILISSQSGVKIEFLRFLEIVYSLSLGNVIVVNDNIGGEDNNKGDTESETDFEDKEQEEGDGDEDEMRLRLVFVQVPVLTVVFVEHLLLVGENDKERRGSFFCCCLNNFWVCFLFRFSKSVWNGAKHRLVVEKEECRLSVCGCD